jgi:23S rRNA (uracil1939-C5)-methyltransferase
MAVDDLLTLTISDLSRSGAGVAREPSGRVVFVPLTAPGDTVRAKVISEKKHYAQGELVEVLVRSPHRVEPRCPVFGKCGGCEWQHLPYALQWETKRNGVLHGLKRIGVEVATQPEIFDELPAEQIWEYRNRVQLRGQGTELGFYGRKSKNLVPIASCPIARPEINRELDRVRAEGAKKPGPYKAEVEVTSDGQTHVSWNQGHAALGFRQVHDAQNTKLQGWVAARLKGGPRLFDLYGGSGNLSLGIAARFGEVHCVDFSSPCPAPAGTPAHYHFHRSALLPWLFRQERASRHLPEQLATSVILDPPREGTGPDLLEIASALDRANARELVLVGCEVDPWARDLNRWLSKGWKLNRLGALDLFPQTHHVEALAFLERDLPGSK